MNVTAGQFSLSTIESTRFGLQVARAHLAEGTAIDVDQILSELHEVGAEVGILRVPSGNVVLSRALAVSPIPILHADTLVYWGRELASYTCASSPPKGMDLEVARKEDARAIDALCRRSFEGYRSHYHANPRFSPDRILDGYAQWARSHLDGPVAGRHTHVARTGGRIVAFLTSSESIDRHSIEVVLNAVDPDYECQGIYSSLLGFVLESFRDAGVGRIRISTQVWNYAVQRIWARHGLKLEQAFDTLHINLPLRAVGERT